MRVSKALGKLFREVFLNAHAAVIPTLDCRELKAAIAEIHRGSPSSIACMLHKYISSSAPSEYEDWQPHCSAEFFDRLINIIGLATNRPPVPLPTAHRDATAANADQIGASRTIDAQRIKDNSLAGGLFEGVMKTLVTCQRCGFASASFNMLTVPPLDLPEAGALHVDTCPQLVGFEETVRDAHCEGCRARTSKTKQDSLLVAPVVLQVQIKRLATYEPGTAPIKSNMPVYFPLDLRLGTYSVYTLCAISHHHGEPHSDGAHFTTLVRRKSNWRIVNDASDMPLPSTMELGIGQADREVCSLTYVRL